MISSENNNEQDVGDLILNDNDSQQKDIINNLRSKISIYELERELKKKENPFVQLRQSKDEKLIRKDLQEQENLLIEIESLNKFSSDFVRVVKEAAQKKKLKIEHLFPDLNTNTCGSKNKISVNESVLSKIKIERKIKGEYKGTSRGSIPVKPINVITVPLKKGNSVLSEKRPSTPTSLISRAVPSKFRHVTPRSRPVTPHSRPVTPRSRPVSSKSRPVTPRSKPEIPFSKPAAPCARPATPRLKPGTSRVQPNNNSSVKKLTTPKSKPGSRQNIIAPTNITSISRPTTPRARTPVTPRSNPNTSKTNMAIQQRTGTPRSRAAATTAIANTSVQKVRPKSSSVSSSANSVSSTPNLNKNIHDHESDIHIVNPFKRPNTTSYKTLKNNHNLLSNSTPITQRPLVSKKVIRTTSKTPIEDKKNNPYLNQIISISSHPLSSKKELNNIIPTNKNLPDEENIVNINNLLQDLLNMEFDENNQTDDEFQEKTLSNNKLKLQEKRPLSSPIKDRKINKNLFKSEKNILNSTRPKTSS
jgi:hypothetical protein